MPNIQVHTIRLKPGEDLKRSIQQFIDEKKITAAWICTAVGSLTKYHIRFANKPQGKAGEGYFELLTLTGTLSIHGSHMHISIGDSLGNISGGHLLEGCTIYTTAEIVIQSTGELVFKRVNDGTTAWTELKVEISEKADFTGE